MQIFVQFAISNDTICLHLAPSGTVMALMEQIRDETGFRLDMMRLTHRGVTVDGKGTLRDQCINEDAHLRLEIRVESQAAHPSQLSYEGFLHPVQFLDAAGRDVSAVALPSAVSIILQLQPDKLRTRLDAHSLVELVRGNADTSVTHTFGPAEAQRRGFVQWTSGHVHYERVMLLEVEVSGSEAAVARQTGKLPPSLSDRRYNREGGEGSHSGSDVHSWQRYTRHMPVPCAVQVDASAQQVRVTPRAELKPGQSYVLLVVHGGRLLHAKDFVINEGVVGHTDMTNDDAENEDSEDSKDEDRGDGVGFTGDLPAGLVVLSDHLIFCATAPASVSITEPAHQLQSHAPLSRSILDIQNRVVTPTPVSSQPEQVDFSVFYPHHGRHFSVSLSLGGADGRTPAKCRALKQAINAAAGLAIYEQQLLINGQVSLSDDDDLASFCSPNQEHCLEAGHEDRNQVVLLPCIPSLLRSEVSTAPHCSIQPYIRRVFPVSGTSNVSTHVLILIEFQKIFQDMMFSSNSAAPASGMSRVESRVVLQCFAQKSSTASHLNGSLVDMEDSLGSQESRRRGYRRWSSLPRPMRQLLVLEVPPDKLKRDLMNNSYGFKPWRGKNGSYRGGDCCSWQRYTDREPLEGEVELCESDNSVIFRPTAPLKPSTTYVIVVANGARLASRTLEPEVEGTGNHRPADIFTSSDDDALFFFSTEAGGMHISAATVDSEFDIYDEDSDSEDKHTDTLCYGLSSGSAGDSPNLCVTC